MLMRASAIICRRTLLKSNVISQEIITCRRIHVVAQGNKILRNNISLGLHKNYRITGISSIRYASTSKTTDETPPQSNLYDEIPDPPTPIQEMMENIVKLHPNGEPTFESLGLGGWSPSGLLQNFLEFMHISLDMPWWLTIVAATVCARILIFPLVLHSQKNTIQVLNHMPVIKELQMKLTKARNSGNHMESAQAALDMYKYMKTNNINIAKNALAPLIQAPIFISFFFALREMANLPVESLKEGGFWWIKDLTLYDPYYIMPIVVSVTMFITIELGTDGVNVKTMGLFRYVLRAAPFVTLPIMIHFPSTILMYWMTTNSISLIQAGIMKIPYVKKALNIPVKIQHAPQVKSDKNFVEEVKESWTNVKIMKQLSDRERVDVVQFNKAGKGPIVKTFKYDPKQKQSITVFTKSK